MLTSARPGRRWRSVSVGPVLLLTAALLSAGCADRASAPGAPPTARAALDPADLDLPPVSTVGVPTYFGRLTQNAGTLDQRRARAGGQVLDERGAGLADEAGADEAQFGAAVVNADLNGDHFPDLVVGAPSALERAAPGRVDLLFGTPFGTTPTGARTLSAGVTGDEYGAAVTVTPRLDGSGIQDLWIGAPGTTVAGHTDAGTVYRYEVSATGSTTLLNTITQDDPLLGESAETGDRFGEVLAAGVHKAVVGVPHEDVGPAADAGEVQALRTDPASRALVQAQTFTQDTTGVPGVAEAGDRFGAAVSFGGTYVGMPGEDVGSLADAGAVQVFTVPTSDDVTTVSPREALTQDSPGIPGTVEAGDEFGAALTRATLNCSQQSPSMVIGAPGEDIGKVKDAGSVTITVRPFLVDAECPSTALSEGSGLPGAAEAGDRVGSALGTQFSATPVLEEGPTSTVLIGDPGEDIGTAKKYRNTGRVLSWNLFGSTSYGYQGGDFENLAYGSVIGTGEYFS